MMVFVAQPVVASAMKIMGSAAMRAKRSCTISSTLCSAAPIWRAQGDEKIVAADVVKNSVLSPGSA
jgi:hypothetical protein